MSYRHSIKRIYSVEYIDKAGFICEERVKAYSATDAEKLVAQKPDFATIEFTELDD